MSVQDRSTTVRLTLEDGYRFRADFGPDLPALVMDEPAPLGSGSGPNAAALLGAAVGNCLGASLLYCLRRAHVDVPDLQTEVDVSVDRDSDQHLRVGTINVKLQPGVAASGRVDRCLELFQDFCIVTESVRSGIDVQVKVLGDTSALAVDSRNPQSDPQYESTRPSRTRAAVKAS